MRVSRRLSTILWTHIPCQTIGHRPCLSTAICRRFLSAALEEPLSDAPPDSTARAQSMKSRLALPKPSSDSSVVRLNKKKKSGKRTPRVKKGTGEVETAVTKEKETLDPNLATNKEETPKEQNQSTVEQDSNFPALGRESNPDTKKDDSEITAHKSGEQLVRRVLGGKASPQKKGPREKRPRKKGAQNKEPRKKGTRSPEHLENIANSDLRNTRSRYNRVSYDALLDAVLTIPPASILSILKIEELAPLRNAYLHTLVKEGIQKGDLTYSEADGTISVKNQEWLQKLEALEVSRGILTCYSVNLKTKSVVFHTKHAKMLFGGDFPTDTQVPWVIRREKALTLRPRSPSLHDGDKMMEEMDRARKYATPTDAPAPSNAQATETPSQDSETSEGSQAPGGTPIPMIASVTIRTEEKLEPVDERELEAVDEGEIETADETNSSILSASGTEVTGDQVVPDREGSPEERVIETHGGANLEDRKQPQHRSPIADDSVTLSTMPPSNPPTIPLEDGYEYLRRSQ
ncbi:hypothetical protein TWF281_002478 [Arthrobotrys megalospora]